ncbi:MAG: DivIVA domain-containing protein [Nitriliruptorales bacterium]
MPLTPEDIVNYELKQALRGYSAKQVDALLDEIADEMERLNRELESARAQVTDAERRAGAAAAAEAELKRALVTAQRAAEQTIEEAEGRARDIVAEAEREAEEMRVGFREESERVEAELRRRQEEVEERLDRLRDFESEYRANLRRLVERHLRDLDELDRTEAVPERPPPASDEPAQTEQEAGEPAS